MTPRPNQVRALAETTAALNGGAKRICVTSPTGGGKTKMMTDLILWAKEEGWRVALYTNRRMLFDQTAGVLDREGIAFGKRASGHDLALLRDVQICMTQTELSNVYLKEGRNLHHAHLVLIDEAHVQTGNTMRRIMQDHIDADGACVGYTATALDIGDLYEELIVAGTYSEMRAIGALVAATTYAPDEPDLRHIKKYKVGEDLTEKDNASAIMRPGIFGRVVTAYRRFNPEQRPTLLFAPGVKESIWFAEKFREAGIRSAHIDGSDTWLDGDFHPTDKENRDYIMDLAKRGEVKVICNRFVLREGIDAPWLAHGIFATVFGALTSYIQSGGRLLRACEGKTQAVIQDHGGNWWRHGSLNADREWTLDLTNHRAVGERLEKMREKKEPEPISCPNCGMVRRTGRECPACGHIAHVKSRMVVQVNGDLRPMSGDIVRARPVKMRPDTESQWKRYYYSQKRAGRTFNQAYAWFFHEEHYWPPKTLPLMPTEPRDWFRKIRDVPTNALRQQGQPQQESFV